jgi:DNA-binding beta-propeller fold protein YncE
MTRVRYTGAGLSMRFGSALIAALCFTVVANAQDELRAYRRIAYESGHGTLTVKKGPGDKYYALNRHDRCIWIFSSSGSTTGRVSSVGMEPADLLAPRDLAVDRDGNAIVADASDIKVFAPNGQLSSSFPFKRPHNVGVLSDGRILVSGFPTDQLMSVFNRQGRPVGGIGIPAKVDDQPFFNAVLNMGAIVVDDDDNIFYVFRYMLTPTVRKYNPDGTLLAEWHLTDGPDLVQVVERAKISYKENKRTNNFGGTAILTAAAFDRDTKTLWVATGRQLTELDSSGHQIRTTVLLRPDGGPLPADGIIAERDVILVSSELNGVFEYPKPR